jgi:hypothetical protein
MKGILESLRATAKQSKGLPRSLWSLAMTKNYSEKKWAVVIVLAFLIVASASFFVIKTQAEKSGGSPNSGATSRIKTIYDHLKDDLSFGSDAAGAWGDWGAYWNRIRSAAEWVPSGNVTEGDVKSGKTFFNASRTQTTGSYPTPGPCSTQQYYDSYGAPVDETTNCTNTVVWTTASPAVTGDDNRTGRGNTDPRTGLTWSQYLKNNNGTVEFASTNGSTWNWDGTLRFTVTAATAAAGDTYTNNGQTFTVAYTIAGATTLYAKPASSALPAASGNLVRVTGSGTDPIVFSSYTLYGSNVAVGGKSASELCSERGNGWRLPSQKELMQVYIDGSYWNLTNPANYFWPRTEGSATNAWPVTLDNGFTVNYTKSANSVYVRCVR